jgi:hypothetical protein
MLQQLKVVGERRVDQNIVSRPAPFTDILNTSSCLCECGGACVRVCVRVCVCVCVCVCVWCAVCVRTW